MNTFKSFESILHGLNGQPFENIALSLFRFQALHNKTYNQYIKNLSINPETVDSIDKIPFLPIVFFKSGKVRTGDWTPLTSFSSSGTTTSQLSKHDIYNLDFYLENAKNCFERFFGPVTGYHILALLPSYLERKNSSLVTMVDHLIKCSGSSHSGFYLYDIKKLLQDIQWLQTQKEKKIILWGVSFALLDLADKYKPDLSDCIVIETGGMKGRRKEITRQELHIMLVKGLNTTAIYSEYGMTELLSQAYSRGGERFYCPYTMQILAREVTDPFHKGIIAETGGLNVIDLANIHSVAFIETEDLGKVYSDGSFEVLGRFDNSDLRGCNLLIE